MGPTRGNLYGIATTPPIARRAWLGAAALLSASAVLVGRRSVGAAPLLSVRPTDDPRIADLLRRMSVDAKVGQLLMIGVSSTGRSPELGAILRDLSPGGIILLGRNVKGTEQLANLTAALQEGAALPRLIAMDQEGGAVVRLHRGATIFPGAMATGATGSAALARLEGRVAGAELAALGVNMNLAPVLDVNRNRQNPVIGVRAYGDDPDRVAEMAVAYAIGLQESGVSAVGKHFPGHGDSVEDSHRGLPTIAHDLDRLRQVELKPFAAAAAAGIDAVMTGHLVFSAVDAQPASLSRILLTDLLRREMGHRGIILTDDLEMKAIDDTIGAGPAAVRAIAAGADMVIVIWRRDRKEAARDAILAALRSGELPMERVDDAVARILAIKMRRGLFGEPKSPRLKAAGLASVGNPHHRRVARRIARRAITVVHDRAERLPLTPESCPRVVALSALEEFLQEFRAVRPGLVELHLPVRPDEQTAARVAAAASRWRRAGTRFVVSVSNEEQAALAATLVTRLPPGSVIGVTLASPYLLDDVEGLGAHLCAFGWRPESVRAVVRVLAGLDAPVGRSPVALSIR